ncbi:unnamed protein product [Darwinula stevensoni]|uniref:Uncharacterized protein n=1 Tax=Darwinula stevensoni TaxID=69355 RepID=A0A7R9A3T2_9CRUS|nr:unnamed protein product [Darwinula stevensoni]CAG0892276.1 unnamed protein product [Darwinula stevensoni]
MTWNKKKFKAQGSRLTIHYVARKDAGVYICKAAQITNQGSVVKTQPITLHVQYAPLAVEGRVDKAYGYIGARVNMTCSVDADPPADFSWTHEGRPMNTTDDVEFFRDNNTSVLSVRRSVMVNGESIYGKYVCDAENSIGNVKQEVNLEKGEPPPVPTLEKITPIGPTSIRIRILPTLSLHHLLKVTGYRIQYKKDIRDRDWQDGRYKDFKASGGEYYVIDALEKGQRYVIRAAAQNQAGYSAYSEARKVQLPPEVQDNGAEWPASNPSVLLAVVAGRMLVGKL